MNDVILNHYEPFFQWLHSLNVEVDLAKFKSDLASAIFKSKDGHLEKWLSAFHNLPDVPATTNADTDIVTIGESQHLDDPELATLKTDLLQFHPWRKGPFQFWDLFVDTEWRSNLKWNRLSSALPELSGKKIMDVGGGNSYYAWRMAAQQPDMVVNVEPSLLFLFQWLCVRKYADRNLPVYNLPWPLETFPLSQLTFDLVLSMGVLYHRKSPFDHLSQLKTYLKPGGMLVMETLVVGGDETTCLVPLDRYAKMRNVWFLPSVTMLVKWLSRIGMRDIQVIDVSETSTKEQRSTEWMTFDSLSSFIDLDSNKTVEGYQRPTRALITSSAP